MRAVTVAQAKKTLHALIQEVCENVEPTIIVNSASQNQAVLISLEDYRSLEETAYLLRTPANRAHLEESLQQVRDGKLVNLPPDDL